MRRVVCQVLLALLLPAGSALAQGYAMPFPTIEAPSAWREVEGARGPAPGVSTAKGAHQTMTGFLIGAIIGGAAGWGFYNAMCEAVDNNCSDSPFRLVVIGASIGGVLGALVGSAYD
jgi:hypothetical protein